MIVARRRVAAGRISKDAGQAFTQLQPGLLEGGELTIHAANGAQLSYLTDAGKTHEGYGAFDQVPPFRRHRTAVSVTSRDIRLAKIANARAQLWLGDVLVQEVKLHDEPADFPADESNVKVGPEPLGADETLGWWVKSQPREWQVGRYPARP